MLLSQAKDMSFSLYAHTKVVTNVNDPSIAGTLFSGFSVQTNVSGNPSPLIQIELDDLNFSALDLSNFFFLNKYFYRQISNKRLTHKVVYVDKTKKYTNFITNSSFFVQLPSSNTGFPSVLISQVTKGVQVYFYDNGI